MISEQLIADFAQSLKIVGKRDYKIPGSHFNDFKYSLGVQPNFSLKLWVNPGVSLKPTRNAISEMLPALFFNNCEA